MLAAARWSARLRLVAALVATVWVAPAFGAVNAYLFVDGIDGPSPTKLHAIDILSFSVGVAREVSTSAQGSGTKLSKAVCSDLSIMKTVDSASIPLVKFAFVGQTVPNAMVVYTRPIGDAQQDYFTITLSNVLVTSVQHSGSNENPTESVSLSAGTFKFSFRPQKPDGSLGSPIEFTGTCT